MARLYYHIIVATCNHDTVIYLTLFLVFIPLQHCAYHNLTIYMPYSSLQPQQYHTSILFLVCILSQHCAYHNLTIPYSSLHPQQYYISHSFYLTFHYSTVYITVLYSTLFLPYIPINLLTNHPISMHVCTQFTSTSQSCYFLYQLFPPYSNSVLHSTLLLSYIPINLLTNHPIHICTLHLSTSCTRQSLTITTLYSYTAEPH